MFWTWIPLDFPPFSPSSSSTSHNRKSQTRRRWPDRSSPPSSMETKMVVQCSICKDESHVDDECPLPNSPCNFRGCNGTRKVRISTRPHSLNRRFLRCNAIFCKSFVWIYEETQGQKTLITSNREACYCCGDKSHFVRDCPVKNGASVECKSANCAGKLKIFTSKKPHSYGKKFFACNRPGCGYFQ
ncbi:hypothetical protein M6B38_219985 [Iris pallida]|uniref:CCHC-type domain-containing protein n=1 Tax=Iris pallida TaxID=29817 RepID=A0AAX6DY71_IRIPA|nr:hypothetical protein M6B38_219985 [Iris pallida]